MKTLRSDEDGSVLPLVAVAFPALLAVAALALDAGYWYSRSTKMSNIADASAISGATALLPVNATLPLNGPANALTDAIGTVTTVIAPPNADSAALKSGESAAVKAADVEFGHWNADAASDGVCGDSGGSFTAGANYPGTINGHTTANAVRVSAHHNNVPTFFYGAVKALFGGGDDAFTISRCGVAERDSVLACFYIMNPNAGAWSFNGNMTINSVSCGIANNGTINGKGKSNEINTDYVCTDTGTDGGEINVYNSDGTAGTVHACPSIDDPYSGQGVLPNPHPTNGAGNTFKSTDTLSSGTYRGNVDIKNGETLTLNTGGTYVFNGNSTTITIKNGGRLVGNNVTIILANGATIDAHDGDMIVSARTGTGDFYDGKVLIQNDGTGNAACGGNKTGTLTLGGKGLSLWLRPHEMW